MLGIWNSWSNKDSVELGTETRSKLVTIRSWLESIRSQVLEQRMDTRDSTCMLGHPVAVTVEARITSIEESERPSFMKWW